MPKLAATAELIAVIWISVLGFLTTVSPITDFVFCFLV